MTAQTQSKDTVFISYAHESEAFRAEVKELADWIASHGIMVVSDHEYGNRPPKLGWKAWMQQGIEDAAVVLVVCSPKYKARFEKREVPGQGKGVAWEGAIITQDLYDASLCNEKFYPILPDAGDYENVPKVLRDYFNDHRFHSGNSGIRTLIEEVLAERAASGTAPAGTTPSAPAPPTKHSEPSVTLPDVWNVPHGRNLNFTGREELLTALEQGLKSGKVAALTALAGLGGVGKTQTALEYVYRHAADYKVIWWVRSEDKASLTADYAALAQKLNLPEKDAREQEVIVEAVRVWLESNAGWLLVFDNVPGKKDVTAYLPRNSAGHVIITSRSQAWHGVAAFLPVQIWKREESKAFLAKGTGRNDPDGADAVAAALGDLPLALVQAAAYMDDTHASYADYLKLFKTRHGELWDRQQPPDAYPATVATTWTLSMEEAEKAAPGAADLMNLCAYLAPDDIPRAMLRDGRERVPEPLRSVLEDELRMNAVVAALRRFSLLEVRDDAFDMHRLVQAVVQDRLDDEARKTWCGAAVLVVNAAYPNQSDDVTTWPICACLTPHVLAVIDHTEARGIAQEATVRLLNQVGGYLLGRAEFGEARTFYERALSIAKAAYGTNHSIVAAAINNLGSVLDALGDFVGARTCYKQALEIGEATDGPNHPETAIRASNLGWVLQELGNLSKAQEQFERALPIMETAYGLKHPRVAGVANNLGEVLRLRGDLPGAWTRLGRALAIDEATYGPNHPNVARDINNMARVLQELGDLPGARKGFERTLRILEMAYGPNHPGVAIAANNLGDVLRKLDVLPGARACFERALAIARVSLGESHPTTMIFAKNLAALGK